MNAGHGALLLLFLRRFPFRGWVKNSGETPAKEVAELARTQVIVGVNQRVHESSQVNLGMPRARRMKGVCRNLRTEWTVFFLVDYYLVNCIQR